MSVSAAEGDIDVAVGQSGKSMQNAHLPAAGHARSDSAAAIVAPDGPRRTVDSDWDYKTECHLKNVTLD